MFTGIVMSVGTVRSAASVAGGARLEIEAPVATLGVGASIACAGVCLTVVAEGKGWFAIDASAETLAKTTVGDWDAGHRINLERPLKVGDELGGHFVLGHIDGIARVTAARPEGASVRLTLEAPSALRKFLAPKGSVTLDGVALTINEVDGATFGINIISHTLAATTLAEAAAGSRLNLEVDPLARYVARLVEVG